MIYRAFRYKLAPTPVQEEQLRQFSGVVRLIYNLAFGRGGNRGRLV